jgi:PAS domain S-box-containing protein
MTTKRKSAATKSTEILVAEDSITQAAQIKHLLESHHYKVTIAHNGEEALNKLSKHKPALVISDIMMPEMNGYELCKKIKSNKDTEHIPVILLTILADPGEIIEGLSCGADCFITKPFNEEHLLSNITKFISDEKLADHKKEPFGVQIFYKGEKRLIQAEQQNVINLMLSIYEGAIHQNERLIQTQEELKLLNERLESMVMDRTADLTEEIKLSNQIADRLKESEERWRTLVLTMPEYIGLVDCDGKFLFLNHYAEGFSEKDTIGKSHLEFIPDEWKEFYKKKFEECINTQRNQVFEYSAFGDNKEIRTYETCLVPIVKQGKVSNVMAVARDITERSRADEKIKFLSSRQEAILAAVPNIIVEVDKNKVYTWANKSGLEFFGNDVIGKEAASFFVGEQDTYQLVQPLFDNKVDEVYIESPQRRKDGEERLLAWWCCALKDKNGDVTGTLSSALDITERKLAEESIKSSEERLKILFEYAPDAYYLNDLKGNFIDGNIAAEKLMGYNRNELIGKSFLKLKLLSLKQLPRAAKLLIKNSLGQGTGPDEFVLNRKDGSKVTAEIVTHPVKIKGHILVLGMARDISERKQAEEMLRESESSLRAAQKIAKIGSWEWDIVTQKTKWSDNYFTMLGFESKEVEPDFGLFRSRIHPDDVHILDKTHAKILLDKTPSNMELRLIQPDGTFIWIQNNISPVIEDEKLIKLKGVIIDITERKRGEAVLEKAAEQMKLAKEKAEANDKLKTTFLNNISHEIRTPLNGILGFAEIMSQADLTEEEKQVSLSMLFESSDRLLDTITNYMDISLITSGNLIVKKKDFVPEQIMKKFLEKYRSICSDRKLELLLKMPEHSNKISINSDPEILNKTLSHLLGNAIKFTEKGSIQYGYSIREKELEFFVKDTGIGIGTESLKDIFEHFVKEDRGPLKITEGSGLGLSISKGLVELLGGKIRVESEKGKGSAFFFTVPVEKEFENHIISPPLSIQKRNKITNPILVAEDDETNFFYLRALLKQNTSAEIIHASNGKEALEKFLQNPDIVLILMDIKMPVMDGLEATRQIKAIKRDVPVIAITAYAMAGDEAMIRDAGCDYYLTKPINKKLLLEKMAEYIEL